MRLTDLNPRWVGLHGWSSDSIYRIGLSFDSPTTGGRLAVLFVPPIDPDDLTTKYGWSPCPYHPESRKWSRIGDTFETLTLTPSLDWSAYGDWHGHITAGAIC